MKHSKILLCTVLAGGLTAGTAAGAALTCVPAAAAVNYWNEPATVRRADETLLSTLIDPRTDGETRVTETINGTKTEYTPARETYSPQDRQWQGIPSVVSTGSRLWAVWYTGGSGEPRQFNYLALAYSDNDGKDWVDPYFIVDHPDPERTGVSCVVPNLWTDGDDLCLTYIQYSTWIIRFHDPDAEDVADVTFDEPEIFTASKLHKSPTVAKDSDGKDMFVIASEQEAGDTHIATTRVSVSKDGGKSWQVRANISSAAASSRRWPESQVAQASDGSLILMSRLEGGNGGGVERSISRDYGYTWEPYAINLGEPFIGPGSKFHIMQLSSGNLLIVNHATTSSRAQLYAYLSEDNGNTWPYKMEIDGRDDVSYPCAYERGGKIYITWDKGRYLEKEIRLTILTEADIKAGELGEGSSLKLAVSKLNPAYTEIVSVGNAYERVQEYEVGTPSADIRAKLPTEFTVTDNKGAEYKITGTWRSSGYKADVAGTYHFTFQTTLPSSLSDTYGMLRIKVVTKEKSEGGSGGCGSSVVLGAGGGAALAAAAALLLKKKGKHD